MGNFTYSDVQQILTLFTRVFSPLEATAWIKMSILELFAQLFLSVIYPAECSEIFSLFQLYQLYSLGKLCFLDS